MNSFVDELRRIKKEEPKQLYWFKANNSYLEKELIRNVTDKISGAGSSHDAVDVSETDINEFRFVLSSGSLLTGGKVILVTGASKVKTDKGKLIADALGDISPSNVIVFTNEDINGATTLGKYLNSNALVIDETGLDDKMILSWARKRFENHSCAIADDALAILVERTLGDLTMLSQEIDKIVFFVGDEKKVTAKDIKETVTEKIEVIIFQVLDELAAKQTAKGIRLLHKIVSNGEPPERIIIMLYNHFLRVLAAQALSGQKMSQAEIAKKLSCHPFVAKKAIQTAAMFSRNELVNYLTSIENAEIAFKTGASKPLEAIETALFQLVK
jgi:DNA polymerase-3 subunit delta